MQIYGKPEALLARQAIEQLIPEGAILDPELIPWKEWAAKSGNAAVYAGVIKASTRIVVYEHLQHIGRGVAEEVKIGLCLNRPIHVLRNLETSPTLIPVKSWGIANRGDWKICYARLFT